MKLKLISAAVLTAVMLPFAANANNYYNPYFDQTAVDDTTVSAKFWQSTGETSWNHTAPGFGDPTSVLDYQDLDSTMFELAAKFNLNNDWFVRTRVGVGQINDGELRDRDYFSAEDAQAVDGPAKFSDTYSNIEDDDAFYAGFDIGTSIFKRGRLNIDAYYGYEYWRERVSAYGVNQTFDPYGIMGGEGVVVGYETKAISNQVEWHSLRLGLETSYKPNKKWTFSLDTALIPYTQMYNEDVHHLRSDLSQDVSIEMDGNGYGGQVDIEAMYHMTPNWDLTFGARYWKMYSDGNVVFNGANGSQSDDLDLNDLDSERYGLTAGMQYRF